MECKTYMDFSQVKLDLFLDGNVKVYQPAKGYRSGVDAILLASIVNVDSYNPNKNIRVLDMGCGVGVASFALGFRLNNLDILGVDNNPILYEISQENKKLNNFSSKVDTKLLNIVDNKDFQNNFDVVISNPPYFKNSQNKNVAEFSSKDLGNMESVGNLADFIQMAFTSLKNGGDFYLIFNSLRMQECLGLLSTKHWGGLELYPIYSYVNQKATRFIIKVKKLSKSASILNHGITMHNPDGSYTTRANNILKNGHSFL